MVKLKQIEADVVIVLRNPETGHIRIFPYWECDMDDAALVDQAAHAGLRMVEDIGSGYVEAEIIDYRTSIV